MSEEYAREMLNKALDAIAQEQEYIALALLEQARSLENEPVYLSAKALCVAKVRRAFKEATYLCREALELEPANPVHYLNLGKIYLLAGQKKKAMQVFRTGLKYGRNAEIAAQLDRLGLRRPPIFRFLSRNHPLNKYFGILLTKVGMR